MKQRVFIVIVCVIVCSSCGRVSKKEYEQLQATCETYRQAAESAREMSVEQAELLDSALIELNEISDRTMELNDIQERSVRKTKAEELQTRLARVKEKVDALEEKSTENQRLYAIVQNLKTTIAEREQTIAALQQEVETGRRQIRKGQQTIAQQLAQLQAMNTELQTANSSLQQAEVNLQKAILEQADMIFEAAENLEELWKEAPKKTFLSSKSKKHKGNLKEKAIEYYKMAARYGANRDACEEALNRLK